MLNKTFTLLFLFLLTSCVPNPISVPTSPSVHLEETVSALETQVTNLQVTLQQTANVSTKASPLSKTFQSDQPTVTPTTPPIKQATPYVGPIKISDMAYAPGGDALYLVRTTDIQSNQDGIEQILYTWTEAIPDLLANFSATGSVLAARLNNGDIAVIGLPQGELMHHFKLGVDF